MGHSEQKYFNLHVDGCGYLQRARVITPRKGKAFLAVTVVALTGDATNPDKRFIDCIVRGDQARLLVEQYEDVINHRERSVFVTFRAGDLRAEAYLRERDGNGKKAGEPDATLKGRLLWIGLLKLDGQVVYRAPADASENAETVCA